MFKHSPLRLRLLLASVASTALLAACNDSSNVTAPGGAALLAKSGTVSSGGGTGGGGTGGGGGGSTSVDSSATSTPTSSGAPVAPGYIGRITAIGEIPAGFYYGTPSNWEVGGYAFKSAYASSFKPVNGPIVVGACVSVTFYESAPDRIMTEMKTLASSKCP